MRRCERLPIRGWPKAILMLLAYHRNSKSGRCDPSIETLSIESGAYRETVIAALAELKRLGVISAHRRRRTSPAYTINFNAFQEVGKNLLLKRSQEIGKTGSKKSVFSDINLKGTTRGAEAASAPSSAQAGRVAPPPDQRSSSPIAARARELAVGLAPAHDSGREGMSAAADGGAPEAGQGHEHEAVLAEVIASFGEQLVDLGVDAAHVALIEQAAASSVIASGRQRLASRAAMLQIAVESVEEGMPVASVLARLRAIVAWHAAGCPI